MNPEIKQAWVEALRSDEYTQGKMYLKRDTEYCCLGVLCDLAVKAGIPMDVHYGMYGIGIVSYDGNDSNLPIKVIEWAGLSDRDPLVHVDTVDKSLATMNDEGKSFVEIANVIEEQL